MREEDSHMDCNEQNTPSVSSTQWCNVLKVQTMTSELLRLSRMVLRQTFDELTMASSLVERERTIILYFI